MPAARSRSQSNVEGRTSPSVSFREVDTLPKSRSEFQYGPAFGSTHSLPAYSSGKKKFPFKIGRGGLTRADSLPAGQMPVYLDEKVMKQVRENTSKFIQQRITNVEKHFGDMCQGLGNYLRRLSKFRDSGDDLAKYMTTYAEKETFNTSTRDALVNFAAHLSSVQDYRDSEIQRLDNKVLGPLTVYGTECKHAKEKLKQAFSARNKEIKEQKNLNKAKSNPRDRHNLSQAETELQKASVDATRASKQLENEMDAFERRKLDDIKRIFLDFVNIEMLFHSRALEMYTRCYQSLMLMSEENDLEEFRTSLRPPSAQSRLDSMRQGSGSRTSLNTTGMSAAPSVGRSTPSATPSGGRRMNLGTPNDTLNTTNRTSMYSETQDEDEDDDEEDDDDEDDEEESEDDTQAHQQYQRQQYPRK